MDVPSREEFEKQQSLLDALFRHLKLVTLSCNIHSEFRSTTEKAIRNCDEIQGLDCPECGFSYHEKYPVVIHPQ
jgi:transposase-like protein